jgi:hypothetical protein
MKDREIKDEADEKMTVEEMLYVQDCGAPERMDLSTVFSGISLHQGHVLHFQYM